MFKKTRKKLTIIFTISFFLLTLAFISVLYFSISHEIIQEQVNELIDFNNTEMDELIEHVDEPDHHNDVEYKPERKLFYYIFDSNGNLIKGEETLPGFQKRVKQELKQGSSKTITYETKWKQSHIIIQEIPIKWDHSSIGTIVIGKDITRQHNLIENIMIIIAILMLIFSVLLAFLSYILAGKAMVPIQRSYEKQRQFVSDASHEMRTPLSIFLGSVELLQREEKKHLSEMGQEVLDDLKSETMHMSKLLESLLFLSRSDYNRKPITKESINLSSLLQSICSRFQTIVPPEIMLNSSIQEEVILEADSTRLQQLIYILLDNALNYTNKGEIKVSLTSSLKNVFIEISDSGQGMEEKDIPHIFDRFYRADKSRDRSGTGLGLSIAKTIIEEHKGSIKVKSKLGEGTTFYISLPK